MYKSISVLGLLCLHVVTRTSHVLISVIMKGSSSRLTFSLGFLVGACSIYFFLHQVWFERSYPVLSEAQEKAAAAGETPTSWRKEGSALINLLHPHHAGVLHTFAIIYFGTEHYFRSSTGCLLRTVVILQVNLCLRLRHKLHGGWWWEALRQNTRH